MNKIIFEKLDKHVFVTKLAGFEYSKFIQNKATKEPVNSNDIPMIQGKNIQNYFFIDKFDWYISKDISLSLPRSILNKECILVPYVGSNLGEIGLFEHPYDCHLASNIAKIELLDDFFDLKYIKYYLQSNLGKQFLFQGKQGSAQPNITMENIRNTLIIYKDKKHQKKISSILYDIDRKISINNKIISKLETMAKTIYDYWFVQFDFPNEDNKPYQKSGGEMVKTELGKIPAGWKVGTINNISKEVICGKTPTTKNKENYGTEIPFITIPDMHNNIYIIKTQKYLSNKGANTQVAKNVPENTICVSCIATVGLVALTSTCSQTNQQINSIIPKKEITPYWVYFYIKNIREVIVNNALGGTTTLNLNKTSFENINIIIPDIHILKKFHNNVKPIFEKIKFTSIENQKLAEIRDFLLPLLMNGQANIE